MAPTTVGPTTLTVDGTEYSAQLPYQRKAFYANGRYWAFFISDAEMKFTSSTDGVAWESLTSIRAAAEGAEFSTWLQEASGVWYIHYAYSDVTGGSALYYRRGTLNADGTISWSTEQVAVAHDPGFEYESIGIIMDIGPYLYICYVKVEMADPNNAVPMITQSLTSPTWTTSPGWPYNLTAVQDASWTVIMAPWSTEIMAIYATDGGNIYSRAYSGGMWFPEVDTGHDIISSYRMSAVSEYFTMAGAPTDVHLIFQDLNEDLIHTSYSLAGGWSAGHTVLTAADPLAPMLTILWYGNEDGASMRPSQQLYCFWLPLTADPTANYVTYKVSRDAGATWTNEAGGAGSTSWIDETAEGLSNILAGSAFYRSSRNPARAKIYIGVLYTNRGSSPDYVRVAGLEFDDPDEDLLGAFIVRQLTARDLPAEFVVRHTIIDIIPELLAGFNTRHAATLDLGAEFAIRNTTGTADLGGEFVARHSATLDLHGEFEIIYSDTLDLPGEFIAQHEATEDLYGEFFVNQAALDLYAYFDVGQGAEDLYGEFEIRRSATSELYGEFGARGTNTADLLCGFLLRNAGTVDLPCEFVIRRSTTLDLHGEFIIRHTATGDVPGEFAIRYSATLDLPAEFIVRHSAVADLAAEFRIDKDYISKGLNVSVYRDMAIIG